jgi:uncharacterized membrane protein YfcA
MSLTMAFGSFIAGATSEGGGAVAFPVMTLLYKIDPATSRDFSLFIQSCGMVAASFAIIKNKIPINTTIIIYASLGAVIGNVLGFQYFVPVMSPLMTKLFFCSLWMSFIVVFYKTHIHLPDHHMLSIKKREKLLLVVMGLLGGVITSLVGTGADIITFALATLYFGISIKVATPSSVIIMAVNSVVCLLLRGSIYGGVNQLAFEFLLVCVPVVIIGAPLGAIFISKRGKKTLMLLLMTSIIAQYLFALFILPLQAKHYVFSLGIVLMGTLIWWGLYSIKKGPVARA